MSKRQDQIFLLEIIKMHIAEGQMVNGYSRQEAIDLINGIIEQLRKTETVLLKRAVPIWHKNKQYELKQEFAYHIANHIMENGYAEPKPIGITNEQTEQYELEISFIRR